MISSPLPFLLRIARAAALLSPLVLAGCPDDEPPPPTTTTTTDTATCTLSYLGNPDADPQLEIIALDPEYVSHPVADGADVSILFPPQGGRVIFAGVRATNIDPCGVILTGGIRDTTSMQVRFDIRTVNLPPQPDGWGASLDSEIATFANIPVCPNQWASQDVFDNDYELTVRVEDARGKTAEKVVTVRPVCNETGFEDECLCICKHNYQLGEVCMPEGGAP